MKQTIFIVEDDTSLQELYTYSLENEFDCRCFGDGNSLFAMLEKEKPALFLLDIMLPGDDGLTILAKLKENRKTANIPVIMVSAKGTEVNKVKGLNMGADDYIAKPFGVLELVARIKANLRRTTAKETQSNVTFKDILFDINKHQIFVNGAPVQTSPKEYNLLYLLCKNAERVQEREDIFTKVWGEGFMGETRTLDIHIKELRKKLAENQSVAAIQTIRGIGYMLV
ncbi:MAG: response regulator transcription factor [Oscillospiraceae bacterium]|nr:response regulator transcription factor [Oscillospiraceae bacterium]